MGEGARVGQWGDLIAVRSRFQRSVHIERDAEVDGWLDGYLVTPLVRETIRRIGEGLFGPHPARAWSLTGPYGSGKSAFALFLTRVLAVPHDKGCARELLNSADPESLGALVSPSRLRRDTGLLTVVATAERRPIDSILLEALFRSLTQLRAGQRGPKPKILAEVEAAVERTRKGLGIGAREVVSLFERAATAVNSLRSSERGLLIVLDEAGKALEFAAMSPARGDIHLLQELAEAANRSGDAPIVFVALLHQSFDSYAGRLGAAQRNEWAKVQGRFEDVAFQEASDQLLRLIGAALDSKRVPDAAVVAAKKLSDSVRKAAARPVARDLLVDALPLHPTTSLILGPVFRSRFCQNERSLFAFLATSEPHGFSDFLKTKGPGDGFYTVDRLYDYFRSSFGERLFGHHGRHWAQIESALRRLPPGAGDVETRLIKAIGMLGLFGEAAGLASSEAVLAASVYATSKDVRAALDRLHKASIIIYRRFKDSFQLFEGSDIDIDALIHQAQARLDPMSPFVERLSRVARPSPIVARKHLFDTGTLRYFDVRYADGVPTVIPEDDVRSGGDGAIVVAFARTRVEVDEANKQLVQPMAWVAHTAATPPVVVVVPTDPDVVRDLAFEMAAIEDVQASTPGILDDEIARRELLGRKLDVEVRLRGALSRLLSGEAEAKWFYRGRRLRVDSSRDLARMVSELCDEVYSKAPTVFNELLNRKSLSSAAAAARRTLLELMVTKAAEERLGIEGFPPELSMYRSFLQTHGFHAKVDGRWVFKNPKNAKIGSIQPVFDALVSALGETDRRLSISKIYERLQRPPYGMKDGVLPVLVLAALLHLESEIALYEDDVFVPLLNGPVIERLLRNPERFELQRFEIAGGRAMLFERLMKPGSDERGKPGKLLPLVRQLVRQVQGIPDYSRNTHAISSCAQAVREALLRAREPGPLVFRDLPRACGAEPLGSDSASSMIVDDVYQKLRGALREIQSAYPNLLRTIEKTVQEAFSLPSDFDTARQELASRGRRLLAAAADTQLKAFLVRATDEVLDRDAWIVSVGTLVAGRPPESWHDADAEQMRLTLRAISRKFAALEAVVVHDADGADAGQATLLRLSVIQPGQPEASRIVPVRGEDVQAIELLKDHILTTFMARSADLSRETCLAALTLAAREVVVGLNREMDQEEKEIEQ